MSFRQRIQYIFDYYKLPLAVILIGVIAASSFIYRHLTKKETILYVGAVNAVTGDALTEALTDGYLTASGRDKKKTGLVYYTGLYITDDMSDPDYKYAYASEIKILGSIEAEKLDVVLMNRKALDGFSENEYLLDLRSADISLPASAESFLTEKGDSLLLNDVPVFHEAGYSDDLFLGVLKNTPRISEAEEYLAYLLLLRNN